jgi:hypothetical protein
VFLDKDRTIDNVQKHNICSTLNDQFYEPESSVLATLSALFYSDRLPAFRMCYNAKNIDQLVLFVDGRDVLP